MTPGMGLWVGGGLHLGGRAGADYHLGGGTWEGRILGSPGSGDEEGEDLAEGVGGRQRTIT